MLKKNYNIRKKKKIFNHLKISIIYQQIILYHRPSKSWIIKYKQFNKI